MILQACINLASSFIVPEASEKRCQKVMPWTDAFVWEHSDAIMIMIAIVFYFHAEKQTIPPYVYISTKMLLEQRKQLKSNQPHRWWGNMVRTQTGFTWLSKPHRVCSVFDLELWPNWRAQLFFPNYGSSAVSVETMLRPSPTMRPEEVYEPGIWAVSLHILSSLVPTCDKNIDCSMTWKLLDPRNGPSNSMTKFVLFPFWAVAIAITPPVVEGVHPASCDAGWSYDRFGATLELAGG